MVNSVKFTKSFGILPMYYLQQQCRMLDTVIIYGVLRPNSITIFTSYVHFSKKTADQMWSANFLWWYFKKINGIGFSPPPSISRSVPVCATEHGPCYFIYGHYILIAQNKCWHVQHPQKLSTQSRRVILGCPV